MELNGWQENKVEARGWGNGWIERSRGLGWGEGWGAGTDDMLIFAIRGDALADPLTASAVATSTVIVPLTLVVASNSSSSTFLRAHYTCKVMVSPTRGGVSLLEHFSFCNLNCLRPLSLILALCAQR